jgi:hypothetical protein
MADLPMLQEIESQCREDGAVLVLAMHLGRFQIVSLLAVRSSLAGLELVPIHGVG